MGIKSASVPLIDSLLTTLAFVATWMLIKRYIEQWLLFVFIDASYVVMFSYKGLYMTAILNIVYTVVALYGYVKWHKRIDEQNVKFEEEALA